MLGLTPRGTWPVCHAEAHGRRGELERRLELRLRGGAMSRVSWRLSVAAALSLGLVGPAGCTRGTQSQLIPPPTTAAPAPPPPPDRDYTDVLLDPAPGLAPATPVEVLGGEAALTGVVLGPDGPVPGATVRLERLVGDSVGRIDVVTDEAGTWRAPPGAAPNGPQGIRGGRYRVRAWRTPDLALTTPQILFLEARENRDLSLELARFSDADFTWSSSSDPPVVSSVVGFRVQANRAAVDADGVVYTEPVLVARLAVGPGWIVVGPPTFTEIPGEVTFELVCAAPGQNPVALVVNEERTLDLPVQACVELTP